MNYDSSAFQRFAVKFCVLFVVVVFVVLPHLLDDGEPLRGSDAMRTLVWIVLGGGCFALMAVQLFNDVVWGRKQRRRMYEEAKAKLEAGQRERARKRVLHK